MKLPHEITGHALLKNELYRKGVLAINIGVIDPGFEGPLSSILINFGREDFVVKRGALRYAAMLLIPWTSGLF